MKNGKLKWENPVLTKYERNSVEILKGGSVSESSTDSPKVS